MSKSGRNLWRIAQSALGAWYALFACDSTYAELAGVTAPVAEERTVIVTVLSWYSPIGSFGGNQSWSYLGYDYVGAKSSRGISNYPIVNSSLPSVAPVIGSERFSRTLYDAALADLKEMKSAGFDVAAFDMLPMPAFEPASALNGVNVPFSHYEDFLQWLAAGRQVGMSIALFADVKNRSADFPEGRVLNVQEWVNSLGQMLDTYGQSPAAWRVDGRPVVLHFGTDTSSRSAPLAGSARPDGGWRLVLKELRASGRQFYFVADVRPAPGDILAAWSSIADAAHMFAPASPAAFMVDQQRVLNSTFSVPYVWAVSPGYYNTGVNAYTEPDFRRIHDTYLAAIKAGAKYMNVMTWNDFGEDTDIAPSHNKGRSLLDVFSYYNEWFKLGVQPASIKDKVVIAYPMRIPRIVETKSPVYGQGRWSSPPYAPKMFYWSNINSKQTLNVPGVGTLELPKGLSMGVVGLTKPGRVDVELFGASVHVPAIRGTYKESQRKGDGGLEYRYVTLAP